MSDPKPMTAEDLAEIEARAAKATAGPWRQGACRFENVYAPHPEGLAGHVDERVVCRMNEHFPFAADVSFIARARADVPALVAEVRRLQQLLSPRAVTGISESGGGEA